MADDITIRRFQRQDLADYLTLHRSVLGSSLSEEKFLWKYKQYPYNDETPIIVAETSDGIVGAIGYLVLEMRWDRKDFLAVRPTDVKVHPDHRGLLFFRLFNKGKEIFYDDDVAAEFGRPNTEVGNLWERFRDWKFFHLERDDYLQNPGAVLQYAVPALSRTGLERVFRPMCGFRNRIQADQDIDIDASVVRLKNADHERLAGIYRQNVPRSIHRVKDSDFYRWRFDHPDNEYTSYIATVDGEDRGAVVMSENEHRANIVEFLPSMPDNAVETDILTLLVNTVLKDNRDKAVIKGSMNLPQEVKRRTNFTFNRRAIRKLQPVLPERYRKRLPPTQYRVGFRDLRDDPESPITANSWSTTDVVWV